MCLSGWSLYPLPLLLVRGIYVLATYPVCMQTQARVLLGSEPRVKVGPGCLGLLCGDTEVGQGEVLDKTSQGCRLSVPWSSPSNSGRVGVAARRSWLGAQSTLL